MKIKIEGLEFAYPSAKVLDNISFEVEGPRFISILGPNGVGKSTLMHCINKILEPTGGSVFIDGKDVKDISLKELAKSLAYVPYSSNDTFPLSVIDTVLMGRHPHSSWKSRDTDLDAVYDALKELGITDLATRSFNELSAGQHQKVMLARGLVQEPKVLLLDEPTSNLDVRHQIEVTKMLKRLSSEKNLLVIMICHDINIAIRYSDEVIMMCDGTIYDVGDPRNIITSESLEKVYGVKAKVIEEEGSPYVVLLDSL